MGMTRQLVYVKRKKGSGPTPQKNKSAALARSGNAKPRARPDAEPELNLHHAPSAAAARVGDEPNWYLRFIVSLGVISVGAYVLIQYDIGALTMDTLRALPSQYGDTVWHGQDARLSGVDREAAKKRPAATEESFLATFRGRANSPN